MMSEQTESTATTNDATPEPPGLNDVTALSLTNSLLFYILSYENSSYDSINSVVVAYDAEAADVVYDSERRTADYCELLDSLNSTLDSGTLNQTGAMPSNITHGLTMAIETVVSSVPASPSNASTTIFWLVYDDVTLSSQSSHIGENILDLQRYGTVFSASLGDDVTDVWQNMTHSLTASRWIEHFTGKRI